MHIDLERFDHEWKHGDRRLALELAREYIARHRSELAALLEPQSLEDLVRLVEAYRDAGREADRIVADMWLLANYDPQIISGSVHIGPAAAAAAVDAALRNGP